jgi:serine/threonine-protein kinase RsbW
VIRLRVPGRLRYRDLAVRVVAAACKLVGTDADAAASGVGRLSRAFDDEVVSAFGEAFNNIAIHGYPVDPAGDVEIEIEPSREAIEIQIKDFGVSYDFRDVPDPDLDALPESGLGIFIIKSFVDAISYRPGRPNVLSLTKKFPQ